MCSLDILVLDLSIVTVVTRGSTPSLGYTFPHSSIKHLSEGVCRHIASIDKMLWHNNLMVLCLPYVQCVNGILHHLYCEESGGDRAWL